jgi:hypothetical protein
MLIDPVLLLKVQSCCTGGSTAVYMACRLSCKGSLIVTEFTQPVFLTVCNVFYLKAMHPYEQFRTLG